VSCITESAVVTTDTATEVTGTVELVLKDGKRLRFNMYRMHKLGSEGTYYPVRMFDAEALEEVLTRRGMLADPELQPFDKNR
jgi:hypothetical protein